MAIFIAATVIFGHNDYSYPENQHAALTTAVELLTRSRLTNGCSAGIPTAQLFVFKPDGSEICGQSIPPAIRELAARVRSSGTRENIRLGNKWVLARPVHLSGNQTCTAVLLSPFQKIPWFPPLPKSALPVSALVTFVFAYFLTNPVRALRRAFRRFAGGDLSVRLPVTRSALRDWGGADIRTLMIDFNEMADRIEDLLSAHKTLLRDVSHELRSPLARLNVALELAREETVAPNEALDRASLESSRLNNLISELLSLSKMEIVHEIPQSQRIDLADLVESLMPDLLFEAESRGCLLTLESECTPQVDGSRDLLRRAIENVIRNAIRHSPTGETVEIQTKSQFEQESSFGVVEICDRGPGVPEKELQSIFRPFYRIDASRQSSTGGFGVGLAIADRAVQIHRGSIRAHNRVGGGLCVEITLPCALRSRA